MSSIHLQFFALCLMLTLTLAQTNTTNPPPSNTTTFAPPPPINMTLALMLNASQIDGRLISSKRIEALQLIPNNTGNLSTDFKISAYDRNAPNGVAVFRLNVPGNWSFFLGTRDTLSCSVLHEFNRNTFGLLQFQPENNNFRLLANDFLSGVPAAQNTTPSNISLQVQQNCDGFYFNGVLYRLIPGSNNASVITVPSGWNPRPTSDSMRYGVASNTLYRLDPNATTFFTPIRTFPPSQNFEVRSWQGRVIVVAANSSSATNINMSVVNQMFYVLNDQPTGLVSLGEFNIFSTIPVFLPFIPFMTSPKLTKIGIQVPSVNSTNNSNPDVMLMIKNVDYAASNISDCLFRDIGRFRGTVGHLPPNHPDYYFGDNYYVIRNATGNVTVSNTSFVEAAYQFVGGQAVFLRDRILNETREITDFRRIWVDTTVTNQLIVLDAFTVPGGLEVSQFAFGSLASINKVLPPVNPPFITLPIPPNTGRFVPQGGLAWVFLNTDNTTTNFTIFSADPNAPNNTAINQGNINGNAKVLTMSDNCIIFIDSISGNITIASPQPSNTTNTTNTTNNITNMTHSPFAFENVTPLIANLTITNTSRWAISDRCDRFAVDGKIFFRPLGQQRFSPIPNNASTFTPSALDPQLTAAISNNSIWLLNPNTSSFFKAFDSPQPILNQRTIRVFNNSQVVVTAVNGTAAQVLAFFIEPTGNFTNCLRFFFPFYQAPPKIQVSPRLTKVLIMGPFTPPNATQPQPKYDAFNINFNTRNSQNISFDFRSLPDPVGTFISLDQKYLYIRSLQMPNGTNITNATNGTAPPPAPQESIFYINQDVTPQLAKSTKLTQEQINSWRRTFFIPGNDGSIYSFVEQEITVNMTSRIVVNKWQITPMQAELNSKVDDGQGITGTVSDDGHIKLCSPGCNDCSSGACLGCMNGYAFDSTASLCIKCGQNCVSCSAASSNVCTSCTSCAFLSNSSSCVACDRSCVTCVGSPTNCTTCPPGKTLTGNACTGSCPQNCITCTNSSMCTVCNRGFVAANGTCRGCASTCSNCSATNITECTSCARGLSLSNAACIVCPDKCQSCNNGICTTCVPGYRPNSAGACIFRCQLSCATCVDNQPSTCLSCYKGANLVGSICQLDLSCNNDSSCNDCGQGLGYVLAGSNCVQCSSLSNCLQCNLINTQQCSICRNGFYVNSSSLCSPCMANCMQCISGDLCTACALGYTLPDGQNQGQCLQCQPPCATCLGVPTYCTSCISGFKKKSWKCQTNIYLKFRITLNDIPLNVFNDIDNIVQHILRACGQNSTNTSALTFDTIVNGSVTLTGSVSTSGSTTTGASSLSSALGSGTLGGYSVLSSSVGVEGMDSNESSGSGLVVGLAVGLSIAVVVVGVLIAVIIYRRKNQTQQQEGEVIHENSHNDITANPQQKMPNQIQVRSGTQGEFEITNNNTDVQTWEKQMSLQ